MKRSMIDGIYNGDPIGLTKEECLAYYAYDLRQKEGIEQIEQQIRRHCLRLAQTRNCSGNAKGFGDKRSLLSLDVTSTLLASRHDWVTFYRGHMP